MKQIENAVIVGMGALGLLFGEKIQKNIGKEHLCYLMDAERRQRHVKDVYTVNREEIHFRTATPEQISTPVDLVIVATKYGGLRDARDMLRNVVSEDTILVSLLNGITSEEILAETIPRKQILNAVAIGMDAVRDGTALSYENEGRWQIGTAVPGQEERLTALTAFLDRAGIAYEVCEDIQRAMWNKFMINVGINQTCMVYETNYGGATAQGPALEEMKEAMREVIRIAAAENVVLTAEDLEKDLNILRSLNPELFPSMRQDALAGRKSEVELFAGTVIRLAEKHGISVPVNTRYYEAIQAMEKHLTGK